MKKLQKLFGAILVAAFMTTIFIMTAVPHGVLYAAKMWALSAALTAVAGYGFYLLIKADLQDDHETDS